MRTEHGNSIRRGLRRGLLLLLAALACVPLGVSSAAAADDAPQVLADGTVDIWSWTRVDSQADLPASRGQRTVGGRTETYDYAVLLLYERSGTTYMVDGGQRTSVDDGCFKFRATSPSAAIRPGEAHFRTRDNVSRMTLRYTGTDGDNGGAKQYSFYENGHSGVLTLTGDGFKFGGSDSEEYTITVMTPDVSKDGANVPSQRVKLFANLSGAKDHPMLIDDEDGSVYTEATNSWDMGKFIMYIGRKEQWSAVTHDITVQRGTVQNLDGYIYVMPDVTITVEEGGVLSCSGVLYHNGYLYSRGDVVVQPGASIEQFCLNGAKGGAVCCDGGDLVILSGGRMTVGESADSRYSQFRSGFLLKNGATCTNFGTLVIGTSAYAESGAAIDNRASGNLFIGYRLRNRDDGNFSTFSASGAADPDNYVWTSQIWLDSSPWRSAYVVYRADRLYVGDDVLLRSDGSVYLGTWAQTLTVTESGKARAAKNVTGAGRGKLYMLQLMPEVARQQGVEWCPAAWKSMVKYR